MLSQFSSSTHLRISNWKKKKVKKNINSKQLIYKPNPYLLSENTKQRLNTCECNNSSLVQVVGQVKNQMLPQRAFKGLIMWNSLDFSCIKFMMKASSSNEQDFMNCDCTSQFGCYTQQSAAGLAVYAQSYIQAETCAHCAGLKTLNNVRVSNFSSLKLIKKWEYIRGG